MNFFSYIGISEDDFIEKYLKTGLVSESLHKDFPLNLYTYSRKTVQENLWDGVTSKCRGIIIHRETNKIIARPFEKFHNYNGEVPSWSPTVIEKVDGFMCTGYEWGGRMYLASKGSFHSIHAKWASAELQKRCPMVSFPFGYTPVFEGLCPDLRIVVDYGKENKLILLGLIDIETGKEMKPTQLREEAAMRGFNVPKVYQLSLASAIHDTRQENVMPGEGYVLTWYNEQGPPTRLKLKYVEYLRLHRMVTGVSPKRVWEVLSQAHLKSELAEYLSNSTPWFTKFVNQWKTALEKEYQRIYDEAKSRYANICQRTYAVVGSPIPASSIYDHPELEPVNNVARRVISQRGDGMAAYFANTRKAFALEFTKSENVEYAPILFALLDGKNVNEVIWKRVKRLTTNGHPLVDSHV